MGIHSGLIAVPASIDEFVGEFRNTWPNLDMTATITVESYDRYEAWRSANEKMVFAPDWRPDNRGVTVYGFVQSGSWCVLLDSTYALAGDEPALNKLSLRFGRAVSSVVETAGAAAIMLAFADGRLARRVESADGATEMEGEPLPEESGLNMNEYYADEAEELQRRLGIGPVSELPFNAARAIAVVDQTDYSEQVQALAGAAVKRGKPWWQFW